MKGSWLLAEEASLLLALHGKTTCKLQHIFGMANYVPHLIFFNHDPPAFNATSHMRRVYISRLWLASTEHPGWYLEATAVEHGHIGWVGGGGDR